MKQHSISPYKYKPKKPKADDLVDKENQTPNKRESGQLVKRTPAKQHYMADDE